MTDENDLCNALVQFRKDWAPRVITKPCMHYNYASLKHAFELLDLEWDNLYKASNDNYDKINLVWRQLIGFDMRRLPGIDRCVMAQGLYHVIEDNVPVTHTYTFRIGGATTAFPDTVADGLGGDYAAAPGLTFWADWFDGAPRAPNDLNRYTSRTLDVPWLDHGIQ